MEDAVPVHLDDPALDRDARRLDAAAVPLRRVRVVADDLTGAADAAVAFVGSHGSVRVSLGGRVEGDVVAIDCATRDGSAAAARAAVAAALADLGDEEVVLKIDSLLRGHVGASVAALCEALPRRRVVVAPAFPALGRTQPATAITAALGQFDPDRVVISEASTEAELDTLVAAHAGEATAWVGSGGITRALARRAIANGAPAREPLGPSGREPLGPSGREPLGPSGREPLGSPFLAAIGSTCATARAQVAALAGRAAHVDLDGREDLDALAHELARRAASEDLVVTASATRALAIACARAAARTGLLLLSGGATARAVLDACVVAALDVVGELEPGVVALRAAVLDATIVTKAGSFGDAGTFVRVVG
jgi:uncharacterized protein YgbK (DUF1537 family)